MSGKITDNFHHIYAPIWANKFKEEMKESKSQLLGEFIGYWEAFANELSMISNEIQYIEISLLRQSLLGESKTELIFEAFNAKWHFGGLVYAKRVIFESFDDIYQKAKAELLWEAKRYMGKIPIPVAEGEVLLHMADVEQCFADMLRESREQLTVLVGRVFSISFGEWRRFQTSITES